MQIVSLGDNLHEVSGPFSRKNKTDIIGLSSAESAHSVVSVKGILKHGFVIFSPKHILRDPVSHWNCQ